MTRAAAKSMPQCRRVLRSVRGFSLVEILVTLVIIAVGMLGIAKLQALAISSTGVASLRSIAAIEASSLAAAMRANRDYWSISPASFTVTTNTVAHTNSIVDTPAGQLTGIAPDCMVANSFCTPVQMASYDVTQWVGDLNAALPNVSATVACPLIVVGTFPISCSITISWTENAVAINTNEANAAAANIAANVAPAAVQQPSYTLLVEP